MSKYSVDFQKLIAEMLPPSKRKPVRIAFIYRLCAWLRKVHAEFITLQAKLEAQAKVTSQVIIFEDYLITEFGAGITITVNEVESLDMFVGQDDGNSFIVGSGETDDGGAFYVSDGAYTQEYNFIINVPIGLNADLSRMAAIVERYKVPGSTYQIIES